MTKAGHWITNAALAATMVALVLLSFWQYRPYNDITFTPFQTDRHLYAPGDLITLHNTFCWNGTPFRAERWFVKPSTATSAGRVEFNSIDAGAIESFSSGDGCVNSSVKVQVPLSQPPGEWAVQYRLSYDPNPSPFRMIRLFNTSNTFTVSESVPPAENNVVRP